MGQLVDVVEETHVEQIVAPVQTARLEIAAPIAAALPAVAQVHAQPIAPIAAPAVAALPAVAQVNAQPIAPLPPSLPMPLATSWRTPMAQSSPPTLLRSLLPSLTTCVTLSPNKLRINASRAHSQA